MTLSILYNYVKLDNIWPSDDIAHHVLLNTNSACILLKNVLLFLLLNISNYGMYKLILIGDAEVGKSCLLSSFGVRKARM